MKKSLIWSFAVFTLPVFAERASHSQVELEFELENNGVITRSKVVAVDSVTAHIESYDDKKQFYKIDVTPRIIGFDKNEVNVPIVELIIRAKTKSKESSDEKNVESRLMLKSGTVAAVAASSDASGKRTFVLNVKADVLKNMTREQDGGCYYSSVFYPEKAILKQEHNHKICTSSNDGYAWTNYRL